MTRKKWLSTIALIVLVALVIAITLTIRYLCADETILTPRPDNWAQPVEMEGVSNLYKLSDDLYRSAQPSDEGMSNLETMGIKTIVNLRSFSSDRDELEDTNLEYVHIYMKAWHPEEEEAVEFLQIVTDPDRVPVLVHCNLGSDRTGTMCAIYRMAVQNWSAEEAVQEMTQGGFGFNEVWTNLAIWILTLDIDDLKAQTGINQSIQE